jgi:hypothetical protein
VQPKGGGVGILVTAIESGEQRVIAPLTAERLHRAYAVERLHEVDDQRGHRLPSAPEGNRRPRGEPAVEHRQRDQRGECNRGQREIEQAHQYRDRHDVEHRCDQPIQAGIEELGERVDVRGQPGDHPPGGEALMERHR